MKKIAILIILLIPSFVFAAISDYQGVYSGTVYGGMQGNIIANVANNGDVYLVWYSTITNQMDESKLGRVQTDGSYSGVSEIEGNSIDGRFTLSGSFTGTWGTGLNSPPGIFSATKQINNAKYAGTYQGTLSGLRTGTWTMVADFTGAITGNGVSASIGQFNVEGAIDNTGKIVFSIFNEDIAGFGNVRGKTVNGKWFDYSYLGIAGTFSGIRISQPVLDYTYYLPVFKPPSRYWSGLGITNISPSSSANVIIDIYNQIGSIQGTESKSIPANGQDNFLIGTTLSSNGWIKVSSSQQLKGMNFLGKYKISNVDYYIADVPFNDTLSILLLISHVAQNPSWDTTIYTANPNIFSSVVTFTYQNPNGVSYTPYTTTIPANGSTETSVATIANSTNIKGGSIKISSSQGVVAFAIYNNLKTGKSSYAGIKADNLSQ